MADRRKGGKEQRTQGPAAGQASSQPLGDAGGYRRLFQKIPDGIYQATPDGELLAANPAMVRMLGYDSLAQLQGLDLADIYVDPQGRQEWKRLIERDGHIQELEVELLRKDGSRLVAADSAYVVRSDGGEVLFYEGTITDVTARKRAENLQRTLLGIFKAAGSAGNLRDLLAATRRELSRLMDTSNFYVALYDERAEHYSFAYHFGRHEPSEIGDKSLPKSLTDYVRRTGRPLLVDERTRQALVDAGEVTATAAASPNWLGVPLVLGGEVTGVVAVQSQSGELTHSERDLELLNFVADNVSQLIERKRAEVILRDSEARFRALFEATPDAIFVEDLNGTVLDVNPAAARLQGMERERLIGMNVRDLVPRERREWIEAEHRRMISGDSDIQEGLAYSTDGTVTPIEVHINRFDYNGREALLLLARDVTERKAHEERLEHLARFDALTDLPNRFLLEDRLRQALVAARRTGEALALHHLDLDEFRQVNETLGHATGDLLIEAVAERLSGLVRDTDTVARLGGDEFVILQTSVGGPTGASAFASRVLERMLDPFNIAGFRLQVSTCIGICMSGDHEDPVDLLVHADRAALKAKRQGPGSMHFHDESLAEEVRSYVSIRRDLNGAVERGEFFLVYQPQVSLETEEIVGAEALVRWQHPQRGLLPPGEFIPVTENTGLIVPIGSWVLEEACRQRRAWCDAGLERVPTAVNLSAVQFRDPRFGARIHRILRKTRVRPWLLELELTETLLMEGSDAVRKAVVDWRERGISIAIDDFGTGYSSLQYLREFPVHKLKIAMEFVHGLPDDRDDAAIVSTVISLGHNMGLKVIAEGVETEKQVAFLRDHGCDEAQGFYFSRPLSAEDFGSQLAR